MKLPLILIVSSVLMVFCGPLSLPLSSQPLYKVKSFVFLAYVFAPDAFLTERIYHIRRVNTSTRDMGLSPKEKLITLSIEILMPYLKRKLDRRYEAMTNCDNRPSDVNRFSLYSKILLW